MYDSVKELEVGDHSGLFGWALHANIHSLGWREISCRRQCDHRDRDWSDTSTGNLEEQRNIE